MIYALPALALALPVLPIAVLLPSHYATAGGLPVASVGIALALARGFDFVIDPLVGLVADRERAAGRGYRRPMIAGALAAGCGLWLLAHPPSGVSALYLATAAMLLFAGWTLVSVPYYAWGADLRQDDAGRSLLSSLREGAAVLGMAAALALPRLLPGTPPLVLVAALAIVFGLPALVALFIAVPAPAAGVAAPAFDLQGIRAVLVSPRFNRLLLAWLLNGLANGLPAVLLPFVVRDYFGLDDGDLNTLMAAYFGAAILGMPLWPIASRRLGRARAWSFAMMITCLVFGAVLALDRDGAAGFALVCIGTGALLGADLALPPALQAEAISADRAAHGAERGATAFALWAMATKAALALAVAIAFGMLGLAGFTPGAGAQTSTAFAVLLGCYAALPIAFKAAAIALVWRLEIR